MHLTLHYSVCDELVTQYVSVCFQKSGKKRWIFGRYLSVEKTSQHNVSGEENLVRKQPRMEGEHKHALAVAVATTATAQAAVEMIRLTRPALLLKQGKAALFIQKIFRGYLVITTISEFSCHKSM